MLFASGLSCIFWFCDFPCPCSCSSTGGHVTFYLCIFAHPRKSNLACGALFLPLTSFHTISNLRTWLENPFQGDLPEELYPFWSCIYSKSSYSYVIISHLLMHCFYAVFKNLHFVFLFFLITEAVWVQLGKQKTHLSTKEKTRNHP